MPPEIEAKIEAAYHLNEPLPQQFTRYLGGLLKGDFGPSYRYRDYTVSELIGNAIPVSFKLGVLAMALAIVVGVAAGTLSALRRNTFIDRLTMTLAMTGISIPIFVVAPLLILFFAVHLHWLPASWSGSSNDWRFLLPVVALALPQISYIARLTRASMIEVLGSDFIRTAKAQGLGTVTIIRHHAMKPAMLPVLSYMGPAIAAVLTGSVVVEQIFGIPGVGQFFIRGALNRDYTLVLGIVIFYATLVIVLNFIVDVLYAFFDPRIRYQ